MRITPLVVCAYRRHRKSSLATERKKITASSIGDHRITTNLCLSRRGSRSPPTWGTSSSVHSEVVVCSDARLYLDGGSAPTALRGCADEVVRAGRKVERPKR